MNLAQINSTMNANMSPELENDTNVVAFAETSMPTEKEGSHPPKNACTHSPQEALLASNDYAFITPNFASPRRITLAGVNFDERPLARLALLGVLSAAGAALQIVEAPLPHLIPWLKPGLANSLVLFALVRLSTGFAIGMVFIRSLLSGLALGLLFSPAHLLGLAGGLAATIVMTAAIHAGRRWLGIAGISVLGAVAHNLAQLAVVGFWAGGTLPIWFHLIVMIWLSIPSGLLVASITYELFQRTKN